MKIISIDINGVVILPLITLVIGLFLILHLFSSHLVTMGINCQINDDDSKIYRKYWDKTMASRSHRFRELIDSLASDLLKD